MASNLPIPFFPAPQVQYTQSYMAQVIRAFSVFAQQVNNPGPVQASTLTLTNLSVYANNAAAVAGGLPVGAVYKTSTGELRIVV
jgi:hypothetical protein